MTIAINACKYTLVPIEGHRESFGDARYGL